MRLPALKRVYKVTTIKVGPVELPVLKLVKSEELSKKEITDVLDQMEISEYKKDEYVEYIITEGDSVFRKGIGKTKSIGEIAKWPVKLRRVGVADELKEEFDFSDIEWYDVEDDVYVFEGKVKGANYVFLDTEEGLYLVRGNTREGEEQKGEGQKG